MRETESFEPPCAVEAGRGLVGPLPPLKSGLRPASATTGKSRLPSRLPKRRQFGLPVTRKRRPLADAQRRPPLPYAGRPACPHKSGGLSFPPVTDFHQRAGKALRAKRRGELPEGRLLWKQATATMIFPFGEAQHFGIADETADVWGRNAPPTKGGRGYPLRTPERHPQAADPYAGRDVRRKAPSLPSPDGSTGSSLP